MRCEYIDDVFKGVGIALILIIVWALIVMLWGVIF